MLARLLAGALGCAALAGCATSSDDAFGDQAADLRFPLFGVDAGRRSLHRVRDSIELGGMPPAPELMDGDVFSRGIFPGQFARNDNEGTPGACKTGGF